MKSPAGVPLLILSQIATKAFTFLSNQLLVRNISPEIFGIAAYLEFLVESVLFFSREAERNAIQRVKNGQNARQIIINFAYVPLVIGVPIGIVTWVLQKSSTMYSEHVTALPYSNVTLMLTVLLIFLELVAEPLFALNQYLLDFGVRSKIESLAVFMRCAATLGGVLVLKNNNLSSRDFDGLAVCSFALGQFVYLATTLVGYLVVAKFELLRVRKVEEKENLYVLEPATFSLWKSLSVQMVFKHLLTEGDHLVVSYLFDVSQQGVYSVIENYGSIVARLLFQPIEESLRMTFTRIFSEKDADFAGSYRHMENLLVFYSNLCLLLVFGGYTNGGFLLLILLGNGKWSGLSVFEYFPQYVLYLPFLAFNGIFEGFFSSASTQKQIGVFSAYMSVTSAAVLALLYILVEKYHWDLSGLIAANMANMALRIVYCFVFMVNFYRKNNVATNLVGVCNRLTVPVLSVAVAIGIEQKLFGGLISRTFTEFFQSIGLCLMCLAVMLYSERQTLRGPLGALLKKQKKSSQDSKNIQGSKK